jgi:hypothetical protein
VQRSFWKKCAVVFALLAGAFVAWVWFSAPPDPIFRGSRLSAYLYAKPGFGGPRHEPLPRAEALEKVGIAGAPLLAAWLETEHPPLLLRLQDLLRKYKLGTQFLPADRQALAFDALNEVPLLGVSRTVQTYLLTGRAPVIRQKTAVIYVFRFNSATAAEQKEVAAESAPFISAFLEQFERTGAEEYALTIISVLIETKSVPLNDELVARLRKAADKSRYLRRAGDALPP